LSLAISAPAGHRAGEQELEVRAQVGELAAQARRILERAGQEEPALEGREDVIGQRRQVHGDPRWPPRRGLVELGEQAVSPVQDGARDDLPGPGPGELPLINKGYEQARRLRVD